ncbi:MAG: 2-oxo acid dehydrogenase subunit E2 [Bradymonadales bacterium]|nr:2-oxo acid dehydrogenase subunit E2 [Bradymonadales bacterium]
MRMEVVVPLLGESITQGMLVAWLKKPGEEVRRGEDLFTLSTDKVDADIPSPVAGRLEEILVQAGSRVQAGEVVAFIETEWVGTRSAVAGSDQRSVPAARDKGEQATAKKGRRPPQADVVRRLPEAVAEPQAMPLSGGAAGRVSPVGATRGAHFGREREQPAGYWSGKPVAASAASMGVGGPGLTVWECDWSQAVKVKTGLTQEYQRRGIQLGMAAFLVQAVVHGLRAFPVLNSLFDGQRVVQSGHVNIGIGDLLLGEGELPIIHRADELSLLGVARSINELAERARSHRRSSGEEESSSFTINNPESCECLFRLPPIIPPLVASLGAGAIRPRVVADEAGSIRVAHQNLLCLSFDPRVIEASVAESFMKAVVQFLEGEEMVKYLRA